MKEVNKTFFCTWLPGLIFIWYLIVMSQVQCRRNILELAHIQIIILFTVYIVNVHTYKYKRSLSKRKKEATDEPQSFECMNQWGVQNQITITCCYSNWLHAYGHIHLRTTDTYTTYSGITQAINHLVTCQWNETYDVCESTHSQQFSIIF